MSYTLTESGMALTETCEGVTMPVDFSFATVNDFIGNAHYEELQALCLAMACEIENLRRGEFICGKCGLRKDGEHNGECKF